MTFPPDPPPSWGTQAPWWAPRTGGQPHVHPQAMRVSNAERAEVTDALCKHFADGRLDEGEFNDRAARTAAAKTRADLAPILADLPPLGHPHHPEVPAVPRRRNPLLWAVVLVLCAPFLLGGAVALSAGVFGMARAAAHAVFPLFVLAVVILLLSRRRGRHRVG